MEIKKYTPIILPYAPDSFNTVYNWGDKPVTTQIVLKKKWQDITAIYLEEYISEELIPDKFRGILTFRFRMYFEKGRRRDEDNFHFICKAIIDEFVRSGLIPDDNCDIVHFAGVRLLRDSKRPRVEVLLSEYLRDDQVADLDYERSESKRDSGNTIPKKLTGRSGEEISPQMGLPIRQSASFAESIEAKALRHGKDVGGKPYSFA